MRQGQSDKFYIWNSRLRMISPPFTFGSYFFCKISLLPRARVKAFLLR